MPVKTHHITEAVVAGEVESFTYNVTMTLGAGALARSAKGLVEELLESLREPLQLLLIGVGVLSIIWGEVRDGWRPSSSSWPSPPSRRGASIAPGGRSTPCHAFSRRTPASGLWVPRPGSPRPLAILALRTAVLPWLLARAVGAEQQAQREATPLVNTASSLLITAGLTVAAFAIAQPLVNVAPSATTNAVPAAFAVVLIALFVMVTRRHAVSQAAGFLMLDNGIAATAFLLTAGVPLIVELGASLDVLFAVIVIGVLTGRLRRAFGGLDLDRLQELHD